MGCLAWYTGAHGVYATKCQNNNYADLIGLVMDYKKLIMINNRTLVYFFSDIHFL